MRLVLDTDVIVRAYRSPVGASAELIRAARAGRVTVLASLSLSLEYQDVLGRPAISAGTGLTPADGLAFAKAVLSIAEPVVAYFKWRPKLRDPGDEHVLEAALNGRADVLLTFNEKDFAWAVRDFKLSVAPPRAILANLDRKSDV